METTEGTAAGGGDLQFDQAEFTAPEARSCALCRAEVRDQYYALNGKTMCADCHGRLQAELAQGSAGARFFAALGWGGGAALLGAAIYYGIRVATGYELGLVAIVVGVLVGKGVARGARGRVGTGYQLLAVALTYLAIVLTYVPEIARVWSEQSDAAGGPIGRAILGVVMVGLTLASPIVVGVKAPLSLVITGIALYEAWKYTKAARLVITGPHALASAAAAPATAAAEGTEPVPPPAAGGADGG
jgi:hypothetical protein